MASSDANGRMANPGSYFVFEVTLATPCRRQGRAAVRHAGPRGEVGLSIPFAETAWSRGADRESSHRHFQLKPSHDLFAE